MSTMLALSLVLSLLAPRLHQTDSTLPHIINVRQLPSGILRGTLVNPLPVALSAWSVDALDVDGRKLVTRSSDAILLPTEFVPPKGRVDMEIETGYASGNQLVFVAALDATGRELGDLSGALKLLERRSSEASALQTIEDFLRTVDQDTGADLVYADLVGLVGSESRLVVEDVRRRASNGRAGMWAKAAHELRLVHEAGAARYAAVKSQVARER